MLVQVAWKPEMGRLLFISHEWVSQADPDPWGENQNSCFAAMERINYFSALIFPMAAEKCSWL